MNQWGFVGLDANLFGMILVVNGSNVPTNSDSAPTYAIRSADAEIATGTMTNVETGVYKLEHSIDSLNFAQGETYFVIISYALSSSSRKQIASFTPV